jgi:hypothetical protein
MPTQLRQSNTYVIVTPSELGNYKVADTLSSVFRLA